MLLPTADALVAYLLTYIILGSACNNNMQHITYIAYRICIFDQQHLHWKASDPISLLKSFDRQFLPCICNSRKMNHKSRPCQPVYGLLLKLAGARIVVGGNPTTVATPGIWSLSYVPNGVFWDISGIADGGNWRSKGGISRSNGGNSRNVDLGFSFQMAEIV